MDKVLVIAAHPDDDILGCGGFMAKYRSKKDFRVIFLAEGSTCRYSFSEIGSRESLAAIATRTESARQALNVLGVTNMAFYDHPCGQLDQVPILKLNKIIESEINNFDPDTIFTHYEHDTNNDHRLVYRSVLMATRPGGPHHVQNLSSFEVQSSTEWNFSAPFCPNYFEALTKDDVATKWKALACYHTEIREYPHPRSEEGAKALAQYRGMQAGFSFAEAFSVVRKISQ